MLLRFGNMLTTLKSNIQKIFNFFITIDGENLITVDGENFIVRD